MATITTVGISLTENERRHLIRLCDELEARDGIDRHGGDNPQARQLAALRKLMGLPVDRLLRDYYVTVCAACRRASCWHGEFMCEQSRTAGVTDVLASELRLEHREHPSCFSISKLREVCGGVRYAR